MEGVRSGGTHRDRRLRIGWVPILALVMASWSAVPLAAQASDSAAADTADRDTVPADTLQLAGEPPVYERETFDYPRAQRRNPFAPVDAGVEEGPRFQNLRLRGVIFSPGVGSVAVLVDESTGRRYRVRDGQRIGQAQVLEIRRTEVLFRVLGPTQARRETLQVEKRDQEAQG